MVASAALARGKTSGSTLCRPATMCSLCSVWLLMGREFVAVIERGLCNRGANIGHYITGDLSKQLY